MKKIKKIVLKSATELTNSEMKSIRGEGIDNPRVCSAACYDHTGTIIGHINNNSSQCGQMCYVVYEEGVGKIKCTDMSYGDIATCPDVDLLPPIE